ncbi:hypothetical protein ACFWGL_17075 [Streptomyces sp. NPDC060286]|uniref:hypothetical protein n=1 Tax=unclassified Streptomyces TaxID=2593676 RepID=UPI0035E044F0
MADHDNSRERFLALAEAAIGGHDFIVALLAELPIPIVVPDIVQATDENPGECLEALNRALDLIEDEPVSDSVKGAYQHMILDWLGAYEILALIKVAGPAPWRLAVVESLLNQMVTWIEMIEDPHLDDDLDDDQS